MDFEFITMFVLAAVNELIDRIRQEDSSAQKTAIPTTLPTQQNYRRQNDTGADSHKDGVEERKENNIEKIESGGDNDLATSTDAPLCKFIYLFILFILFIYLYIYVYLFNE